MAANAKQGTYLASALAGFTVFPAGVIAGGGKGIAIAVVGLALLLYSAFGFYKIKGVEV